MANLPHHRFTVEAHLGPLHLHADATLTAPWTVLFGPSGSGKSTILRALAGLIAATPATEFERHQNGTWLDLTQRAPHRRSLGYAPQHASLFPHLTVAENIAFPYAVCASPPKQSTQIEDVTSLFGLHSLRSRYPAQLSGGERRRVSLARAFATPGACLLLLDEPFAGLDRKLRDDLLPRLQDWLTAHKLPALSVTHDVDEALLLNAEVLRLDSGLITAQGPAQEVLADERQRLLTTLTGAPHLAV